ncbi:Asparagine-rich protein (ARP protein) [Yamadazyma tenuis]|uniref:Asparagine-rich protein (ARP protein) n=1 Tax=Candida tenuis TaxID=2315449 RepID=UPI0027A956B3|nr:Asparagine-rich protein (ARP protein) [Yamadazyma tenuis]
MSDVYVALYIATTCDDSSTYISRDATEIIELAWSVIDAASLDITHSGRVLVCPTNTPITPYCTHVTRLTYEDVKCAVHFKDAVAQFDKALQTTVISEGKQFSFVSMDISKLRVQLPREARDKAVVLPPYLQHPRAFDLQNEYCKWQTSHPEALSYTASSLANIVTALEVDLDREDLPSPVSDLTPPPSASSATPPPAGTTDSHPPAISTIYAKILVQLAKKSLPVEAHPSVLSKPYDSSQDVKSFLNERSKILYIANLSYDTTQSELESWFTQYGARPIAFWTLKNLESGSQNGSNAGINAGKSKSKGISGFAVFGTHEEATETLSLNGRALNDRAVEIQPSSTHVLDKASELLTPFPPSKNQRIDKQNMGGIYYDSYHGQGHHRPNSAGGHHNPANSVPFRAGDWKCTNDQCQYHNFAKNLVCLKCGMNKPLNMHSKVGHMHNINSTAAAIAAATASGQPLNLNSQPQKQTQYKIGSTNLSRTSSNGTHSSIGQTMASQTMGQSLSNQSVQQPHILSQQYVAGTKFSSPAPATTASSPGMYQAYGYSQYQAMNGQDPALNFNSISNQFNSLNLNNN